MKILAIAAAMIVGLLGQSSEAVPMPPMATVTIEGTIQKISWHAEKSVKGSPGASGSAGDDRIIPAHYEVTLVNTKVTPKGDGLIPFESGQAIVIALEHPKDDNFLTQNMTVRILDFTMRGDEGRVSTAFQKIEILNGTR